MASTSLPADAAAQTPGPTTRQVVDALREVDARLVASHPWLGRDDLVAAGLFVAATGLIAACVVGWTAGVLATPWTILGIMLATSVLHEMEHDLIHDLYLAHPVVRVPVLTTIWFVKASIDPWTRGRWHRWHHKVSGQEEDIEERLIGLGLPWGPFRVLITCYPPASIVLKPGLTRAVLRRVAEGAKNPQLLGPKRWLALHGVTGLLSVLPLVAIYGLVVGAAWAWPLLVLWVLPNTIRHGAIAFMSSNSHYTHIQRGVVVQQNQILDHPVFWPLQVLCWNFGATHVVHHFFVRQPFWRRTLIFGEIRQLLVDHGVPANDLQTFRRANRREA